jgi:hypothetical protein
MTNPPRLPAKFPTRLTDDQLGETLGQMLDHVNAWGQRFDVLLPELHLDLIAALAG